MTAAVPIVLVGYGRRGRQWHETCGRRSDMVVVGVVEPDEGARPAGLAVFESPAHAAASAPPGAWAIVASPLETHPPVSIACLAAGLGVMVEKPLALSVADGEAVAGEAAARRLPALVVQNFRYLARERAVARALAGGMVGRPLSAEVESSRAVRSPAALWDFALHHLDAFRARLGAAPATATAARAGVVDVVLTWDDGFELRYRHDDGAPGYRYRERLAGTGGTLTVDDQRVRVHRDGHRWARTVRPPAGVDPDDAVLDELVAAATAGGGSSTSPLSAAGNVLTVAMVAAVATVVRDGGTVKVDRG